MKGLGSLLGLGKGTARDKRARLRLDTDETAVYAVGDVHGCLDELLALEAAIAADGQGLPGRRLILMLGDYVDRGPASWQSSTTCCVEPARFERICLPATTKC